MAFLDELQRINQQDFLGGLVKAGEAIKEQKENETLVNLWEKFKAEQTGLSTREEQVSQFNTEHANDIASGQDSATQEALNQIKPALNLYKALNRSKGLTDLYSKYGMAFSQLGEDGQNIAKRLDNELQTKLRELEFETDIPIKELQFKSEQAKYAGALLNNDIAKFNYDTAVKNYTRDEASRDLLAKFYTDSDGQQLWSWMSGTEYQGTVLADDPKVKDVRNRFFSKFSGMEGFDDAFAIFANNPKVQRRSILMPSGGGGGGTGGKNDPDTNIINLFSQLQDDVRTRTQVLTSKDPVYTKVRSILEKYGKDIAGVEEEISDNYKPDSSIARVLRNYIDTWYGGGDKNYYTRYRVLDMMLQQNYGKRLDYDLLYQLPDGVPLLGKDLVHFNKRGDIWYEPHLGESGYYLNNKMQPAQQQRQVNPFAPVTTQNDVLK